MSDAEIWAGFEWGETIGLEAEKPLKVFYHVEVRNTEGNY